MVSLLDEIAVRLPRPGVWAHGQGRVPLDAVPLVVWERDLLVAAVRALAQADADRVHGVDYSALARLLEEKSDD